MKFEAKTYLTRPIIGCFVIGLLVGGLIIGIVDANRPQPLFSSASPIDSFPIECVGPAQQVQDYLNWANGQPRPVRPDIYAGWEQEYVNITNNLVNCVHSICDPLNYTYNQASIALLEAQDALREANNEATRADVLATVAEAEQETAHQAFDDALADWLDFTHNVAEPYTASQQTQYNQLTTALQEAGDALTAAQAHFNELNGLAIQAHEAVIEAQEEMNAADIANDQAYQVYHGQHCDSAMAFEPDPLDPNDPPDYTPSDPYNQTPGYDQPPTNTPNPTPTGPGPRSGGIKDDTASSTDSDLNNLIPKIPSADKTRAY